MRTTLAFVALTIVEERAGAAARSFSEDPVAEFAFAEVRTIVGGSG